MRIHVHNQPNAETFRITPALWEAACARAGTAGHVVTYGDTAEDFHRHMQEAEGLISTVSGLAARRPADGAGLHAPKLKLMFCTSAGVDRLAPFDWLPRHAALLNNRGTHAVKAGEYAAMALLMLSAGMPTMIAGQNEGVWRPVHTSALRGRHLVAVGLGSLGGAGASQAAHFGMHVTGVRTRAEPHPACRRVVATAALDTVLPEADFLLLACPLTPATRNLLDRRRISLLPPGAKVINMGRGPLLDQEALCDALDAGALGGAMLDVFVPEPVPPGHRLWRTKNLVMTPHVSTDDPATYTAVSLDIFLTNLAAHAAGRPLPNRVDLARGY